MKVLNKNTAHNVIWVLIWLIGSFAGDLWRFQETKERKGKKKRR